jgi:hypothetical protein
VTVLEARRAPRCHWVAWQAVVAILKRQGVVRDFAGGLMMIGFAGLALLVTFVCGIIIWALA